ncbi:MAG: LysM peptidoglycan-binding domain-containing protein [Thermodesulfobacteriota bacterium]
MKGWPLLPAALALFLLFPDRPAASQETEGRPQIFFEKKVYSDTAGGKRSFFETHVVEKGESLWKILGRSLPLTPERYAERLKEFRRANPQIADPSRLTPGQRILVPAPDREEIAPREGTVPYEVRKGDSLSRIFASRGVPGSRLKDYLEATRELNRSVDNVDLIYAGKTLRLPTEEYFAEAATPPSPDAGTASAPLTRDVASAQEQDAQAAGKPPAELLAPQASPPEVSVLGTGKGEKAPEAETAAPPATSPYRGLLSDVFDALGEAWMDKGTMFLPLPSGEELVLLLPDFPLVKFQGGEAALIDFRGGLPARVRDAITENWKYIQVVSLEGARGAGEAIDRILRVSGYHSVKDGLSRPLVIGETVSVVLPARWVIQRTPDSLLAGDLVLLKETPEKPSAELASVIRFARRVGVRVLPYADNPGTKEGFLVGIEGEEADRGAPVALIVPEGGGLAAADFTLNVLGIVPSETERLQVGGARAGFQLTVQPERTFRAGGTTHVVDTGKISGAIRTILKDTGYSVIHVGKQESGRQVFERIVKAAGGTVESRKEHILSGGGDSGYTVRLSGAAVSFPPGPGGKGRKVFLVRGKAHSATRALLRDLGVEIVEW